MNEIITNRLATLRRKMLALDLQAYFQPNTDPHLSEYQPDHWKCIAWATGFTGEAASFLLTPTEALLWTDSRFFVQAEQQLEGTGIRLMRSGLPGTPTVAEYLSGICPMHLGCNGRLISNSDMWRYFYDDRSSCFGALMSDIDLFEHVWADRPALPAGKLELYGSAFSGEETIVRLGRIREALRRRGAGALLLTRLDDVAWALNVRGTDIHCTPVCTAYALITMQDCFLFVDPAKCDEVVRATLADQGITVKEYSDIYDAIWKTTDRGLRLIANEEDLTLDLYEEIDEKLWMESGNPVPLMRALKNTTEMAGYRSAMVKDGVALVRFYRRLEQELAAGRKVTELDCVAWLIEERRRLPLYREESFDAIVAWGGHAAMPHYFPTPESNASIEGDGLLLIDTGGQYQDGTTDITRTIAVGTPTEEMCADYTRVLKGHIRLARACFPAGTRGDQLDALARMDLWREGKTYRHGTSHGVGHCLCVHEGPESVRMEHNPQVLLEGMVLSNEPAIYVKGEYGVRHENCVAVRHFTTSDDGQFLRLETLTLFPIDTTPIVRSMLTQEEVEWLNEYNETVFNRLAPQLTVEEATWLRSKTEEIDWDCSDC
jgi:Xaa-Pro aminopeptidase